MSECATFGGTPGDSARVECRPAVRTRPRGRGRSGHSRRGPRPLPLGPAARAGRRRRQGQAPPLRGHRAHRDVHHRAEHQLHQFVCDGVQVLRLLRLAQERQGVDPRLGRHPAPLRRDGGAGRHPDHVPGRPPPRLRRGVLRGALRRDQEGVPAAGHPLPRRQRGRAHGADLQGHAEGGHRAHPRGGARLLRGQPAPNCCPRGPARPSRRSRSRASAGWRSWRSPTGSVWSRPPRC